MILPSKESPIYGPSSRKQKLDYTPDEVYGPGEGKMDIPVHTLTPEQRERGKRLIQSVINAHFPRYYDYGKIRDERINIWYDVDILVETKDTWYGFLSRRIVIWRKVTSGKEDKVKGIGPRLTFKEYIQKRKHYDRSQLGILRNQLKSNI